MAEIQEIEIDKEFVVKLKGKVDTDLTYEQASKTLDNLHKHLREIISEIVGGDIVFIEPVKHGHWIYKKRTKLVSTGIARVAEDKTAVIIKKHITVKIPYCSICGERGGDDKLDATPYCPYCGAKMDGDADA